MVPVEPTIRTGDPSLSESLSRPNRAVSEQSVPDCFERVVERHPHRPALGGTSRTSTYNELNQTANQISRATLEQTSNRTGSVALLFATGASFVGSTLGALKLGCMYVPLDRRYPPSRLSYMLRDSQAGAIVTDSQGLRLAHSLAQGTVPVINVDEIDSGVADSNLGLNIAPDTTACLYYTSGSSGRPKGVVHTHRNMVFEARTRASAVQIGVDDRVATFHSNSALVSMTTSFSTLLHGASLHPLDVKELGREELLSWMEEQAITVSAVRVVLPQLFDTSTQDETFPNLRVVSFGADAFHSRHIEWARETFSPDLIRVGFASTETGAISELLIHRAMEIPAGMMPAGYSIESKEVLLLDEEGQVVCDGEIGEIAVRSRYLSPGYWRRPNLTQTRFLPDPQGSDERIYLTGDLGRRLADDCLVHLGRKDLQVKIRGFRVELGEVEHALLGLRTIRETVVVGREDVDEDSARSRGTGKSPTHHGDRRLVAYLVSETQPPPTVTVLRRALVRTLPDHMLPSAFVFVDALPRGPSGKVDRAALPAPDQRRPELEAIYVAPRTPVEVKLGEIWAKVLRLERVGVHDDFFELGGHSLLATQVVSRIREVFHIDLPLRSIFETPSIAELSTLVEQIPSLLGKSEPSRGEIADEREEVVL